MSKYLSQVVKSDMNQDMSPNHIYMDLSIVNNDADSSHPPVPLIFTEMKDRPIIDNPQEFYISVIRFHIDTFTCLPVFIPQIMMGDDPNQTIYSFTLEWAYNNATTTKFVQTYMKYTPQDLTQPIPAAPSVAGKQDMSSNYYLCMNNSHVVSLINQCLVDLYAAQLAFYQSVHLAPSMYPNMTNPPWLAYDNSSHQLIFNFDAAAYDPSLPSPFNLYCNTAMFNLLNSFEFVNYSSSGNGVGANYKLNVYDNQGTNSLEMPTYTALQLYEDYPSVNQWSPVSSIVLTSNTLPINGTIQGAPKVFNTNNAASSYSVNNSMKVISDFTVAIDNNNSYRPSIDYSPTIYRMVDMIGHSPINYMDIQLYWRDIYNNFYPMTLGSNQSCSIKLLFRKKSLGI